MSRGALRAMFRPYVEFDFTRMSFDTRVSFSRSSTGTNFDAAGVMQTAASNVPRKGHDPATGAVRGLLVEEQRTNLVPYSEAMAGAGWGVTGLVVSNDPAVLAPDGNPAIKLESNVSNTGCRIYYGSAVPVFNTTDSFSTSVYLKAGTYGFARLSAAIGPNATPSITVDLLTGQYSSRNLNSEYVFSVVGLRDGWWRVSVSRTATTDRNQQCFALYLTSYSLNADSGWMSAGVSPGLGQYIYAYAPQFEAGSYPTSSIPTTAAAVTRAADVAAFTIPPRVVRLVTIYHDGTTAQETVTPGASYTIPSGQKPILRIRGYFA